MTTSRAALLKRLREIDDHIQETRRAVIMLLAEATHLDQTALTPVFAPGHPGDDDSPEAS